MKRLRSVLAVAAVAIAGTANAQTMVVSPNGSRASVPGPAATFTGNVTVTPLFAATEVSNATGGLVEFAPGARSNWHTHPAGQTLIVTAGSGWVQEEGGEKIAIKPGDVVLTKPGTKHWHGASIANSMSHVAITATKDGQNVEWLEPVSDAQYR